MRNHYAITSHTPSRLLRFLTAAMVAALVGAPHASAQSQGQLFASVTTQEGEPVLDLTADSFQVQEDGVTMKILSADPGTTPMKVAVLVDNSEAINASNGLTALRRGITGFLETLPLQHEVGLFSIAGRVAPLVDFTNDRDELLDAADGLFAGSGGAKMIDGMRETWDRRFSSEDAWPVMVMVVTDGPETSGNMNEDQFGAFTLDLLSGGAMVHVVVVGTKPDRAESHDEHGWVLPVDELTDSADEHAQRVGDDDGRAFRRDVTSLPPAVRATERYAGRTDGRRCRGAELQDAAVCRPAYAAAVAPGAWTWCEPGVDPE